MSEKRLEKLERVTEELKEALAKIERREEIKRILADQNKGISPYIFEIMKYLVVIIMILVARDKAMSINWIAELVK
jgi:hypothetical protein